MGDHEPQEDSGQDPYATAPDGTKRAIERQLVGDVIREPETALSFGRTFNRDTDFTRIFSRGGGYLEELKTQELMKMDDAAFATFTDRLRTLQDMAASDQREDR